MLKFCRGHKSKRQAARLGDGLRYFPATSLIAACVQLRVSRSTLIPHVNPLYVCRCSSVAKLFFHNGRKRERRLELFWQKNRMFLLWGKIYECAHCPLGTNYKGSRGWRQRGLSGLIDFSGCRYSQRNTCHPFILLT